MCTSDVIPNSFIVATTGIRTVVLFFFEIFDFLRAAVTLIVCVRQRLLPIRARIRNAQRASGIVKAVGGCHLCVCECVWSRVDRCGEPATPLNSSGIAA